ncbi:MAG: hypothetical protein A2V67_02135 [Deltaproteobacteria bacterium RBG_13_61_14]|nr:MAG: hypothetical protein A2V67_02135 [Deltaproteobacteria bacterium RBG_13_61_14]
MKAKLFWIGFLGVMLSLALIGLNCQGEQEDHSTFEARSPIWNPGTPVPSQDFCHDGRDNDSDGLADENGVPPGCAPGASCIYEADPGCQVAGSTGEAACSDNLDNDRADDEIAYWLFYAPNPVPTLIDKADPGCWLCGWYFLQLDSENAWHLDNPECCDGVDNDCDGDFDFEDDNCVDSLFYEGPLEVKECNDGLDNDGDGDIDTADSDCADICGDAEGAPAP